MAKTSCCVCSEPLPKLGPLPHLPVSVKFSVPPELQLGEGTQAGPRRVKFHHQVHKETAGRRGQAGNSDKKFWPSGPRSNYFLVPPSRGGCRLLPGVPTRGPSWELPPRWGRGRPARRPAVPAPEAPSRLALEKLFWRKVPQGCT